MNCKKRSQAVAALLGAVVFLILSAVPAKAYQPAEATADLHVPLPAERIVPDWDTVTSGESPFRGAASFESRAPGPWFYWWNEETGTAHQVWGWGTQFATSRVATAEQAEALAREFIRINHELFGTTGEDLVTAKVTNAAGKWGVVFEQVYKGLPVVGGRAHVLMTEAGRISNFGSDIHPGIDISINPATSSSEALDIAMGTVGYVEGRDSVQDEGELAVIPDPTGGGLSYHLAYRNRVKVEDPLGLWLTTVDANTGEILGRWNDIQFLNYQGNSRGDIEDLGWCDGQSSLPARNQNINISGVGTLTTDENGDFFLASGDTDPTTYSTQLLGPYHNTNNVQGADAMLSGVITPGEFLQITWNDGNAREDERDEFYHANMIHDWIKTIDPNLTQADYVMSGNVNRPTGSCNAYWDGVSINFYHEAGTCANTARIGDVVYHEYTHGITQWTYGTNNCNTGEPGSDTGAMLLSGSPIMGKGFYIVMCNAGIRGCANGMQYPDDYISGDCYHNAMLLCAFWFDARTEMLLNYTEDEVLYMLGHIWHFSRKLTRPQSFPDQVLQAFVVDDDNGNIYDGTPHYDQLCYAAEDHGFSCPVISEGVMIVHTPVHSTTEENVDFDVVAEVASTGGAITSVDLHYSTGGSFVQVPMNPTGNPDEYGAVIPGQPQPTEVEYYIIAQDSGGNEGQSPSAAPDAAHMFHVATVYESMETDAGWTVDPNDTATGGRWERVDPVPTLAQPESDRTPWGTDCWVTGQHPGGDDGVNDVDGGQTTLLSPTYDLSASDNAVVRYWRWFSNNMGSGPGRDSWVVKARNDGGSWVVVESTLVSSGWVTVEADLNALLGQNLGDVEFKFTAEDIQVGSLVEAAVDEFTIFTNLPSATPGQAGQRLAFNLGQASPNPFNPWTAIRFEVPATVHAELHIYGVDGRLLRTLMDGIVAPGRHTYTWDSRDDAGRQAAAGVYYYVLEAGDYRATRRMVLLK